ncbi:MAG: hypothetical protein ACKOXO_08075 [Cyanobium sp.]
MYLLTIRDGLKTRHIGPYESPARAVEELDALLQAGSERVRWQIHELEPPLNSVGIEEVAPARPSVVAA